MNPFFMRIAMTVSCLELSLYPPKYQRRQCFPYLALYDWALALMAAVMVIFFSTNDTFAQESKNPLTAHVVYGRLLIENNGPDFEGDDYDIYLLGTDAQMPFGGEILKYGIEVGGLFNWDSDTRWLAASSGESGGQVAVAIDINSFLIDFYFGGYLSFEPAKWLRLYVGAGPLIIWGLWETEAEDPDSEVVKSESESKLGAGIYARAGLDIIFTENIGLTVGSRINQTTLSFEDTAGEVDVEGWQYFFGLAIRF